MWFCWRVVFGQSFLRGFFLFALTGSVWGQGIGNDAWQDSIRVWGAGGTTNGSNVGATVEAFEPPVNTGGHSVWYRWVPPASGTGTVTTAGSEVATLLAVFGEPVEESISLRDLVLLGNAESSGSAPAKVSWNAEPGHNYWFAIDGTNTGNLGLSWELTPDGRKPDLVPSIGDPVVAQSTGPINACEIGHGCGDENTRRMLRFGTLTRNVGDVDLYLAGIPGLQYEYHPCHQHTHLVGYADYRVLSNGVPVRTGAKASFCLQDGGQYETNAPAKARYRCSYQGISRGWGDYYWSSLPCQWVDVTGLAPGRYTLQVEIDPERQLPESNDENNIAQREVFIPASPGTHVNEVLETATELAGLYAERTGENVAASRDAGEPIIGAGHTVWYRWVAPSNDVAAFDVMGSFFPAALGVYTGTSLSNLVAVTNTDPVPVGNPLQRVIFQATAGTAYYVIVDSVVTNSTGVFRLNWWFGRPPNDDFARAQGWDSARYGVHLNSANATKEPGEPYHAGNPGGRSVWTPWLADITREYVINTEGSNFDTLLAVYTGDSFSNLEEIASNDDVGLSKWSQVRVEAIEGTQYWIAVDGRNGAAGRVFLSLREVSPPIEFLNIHVHGGDVELELTGPSGRSYAVEASTNLVHWFGVRSVYKDAGPFTFTVPVEAGQSYRFFRARMMPDND